MGRRAGGTRQTDRWPCFERPENVPAEEGAREEALAEPQSAETAEEETSGGEK